MVIERGKRLILIDLFSEESCRDSVSTVFAMNGSEPEVVLYSMKKVDLVGFKRKGSQAEVGRKEEEKDEKRTTAEEGEDGGGRGV